MATPALRRLALAALAFAAIHCKTSNTTPADAAVAAADAAPDAAAPLDAGRAESADAGPTTAETVARGKLLYGRYCGFCHGENGQGYKADQAPALANDDFLALATDDFLRDAMIKGRPNTTMSAWATARGGPLRDGDTPAIIAYLRSWQKRPSEPTEGRVVNGKAEAGAATYASHCASCHGAKGRDGKHNALSNPELLASASDGFLATTIDRGRAGTPMPGFAAKLSKREIDNVVALLRSWQRPPDELPELPPTAGHLGTVVVNPKGPSAELETKLDFVPVDAVKREVDRGASIVIIDARPPMDYARMHIAGAISVPFYQTADYAAQLPKDRTIVTYCACPHAESGQVRDALRKLGYPRVSGIDEGLLVWRDRGYPVRGGPKP
jgi:cytochrome c oxidase cbb3-type subunit 3